MTRIFSQYRAVLIKDLTLEFRTKDVLSSLILFSVLTVVVMAFGFTWAARSQQPLFAPGALWVNVLFTATVGFNRFFDRERENNCFEGILLTPVNKIALFAAKSTAQFIFNTTAQLIFVPLIIVFFNVPVYRPLVLILQLLFATLGISAIGTLFASLLMEVRVRDVLLPLIVFPLTIPQLLAGVKVSYLSFSSTAAEDPYKWLYFTLGYATISWILGGFIFGRHFQR